MTPANSAGTHECVPYIKFIAGNAFFPFGFMFFFTFLVEAWVFTPQIVGSGRNKSYFSYGKGGFFLL
jgi:hypothetical protein